MRLKHGVRTREQRGPVTVRQARNKTRIHQLYSLFFSFFSHRFSFFFVSLLFRFVLLFSNPKNVRVSRIVKLTNLWSCIYTLVIPIFFFFISLKCFFFCVLLRIPGEIRAI